LRLRGLERYRELGTRPWLRFDGALRVAGADETERVREVHEHLRSVGYATEWISREDAVARVPGVEPSIVPADGAMLNPDEGWVDLPSLISEMTEELRVSGCVVESGVGPASVVTAGRRVVGVRAGGRTHEVDAVVVATGAGVPRALAEIGVDVPDGTTPGLLVRTRPLESPLRVVLNTPRVALRPAPDGGLVMDAGWSEREVAAGADGSYIVSPHTVQGLLDEASRVLAGRPTLRLASYGVGPKPIPGDGQPVLGRVQDVAGYHVAFTHSGATLALVAGELVAAEVLDDRASPELDPFRADRFGRATGQHRRTTS
jgi:glycine/D-amino acid oxidase-like deaminating enzyme